jgi:hypothetical protein
MKVTKLSSLRTGRLYLPEDIPDTHFSQGLSRLQGRSAAGRNYSVTNVSGTIGKIEPAIFRLVAQYLNQLRQILCLGLVENQRHSSKIKSKLFLLQLRNKNTDVNEM